MADGTTLSAATFVCAVLEQAGYLAQAEMLHDFKAFFREAGAFLYLISIAAGIISFVIFGSFRAARYLILGPAFFWFLIGPTSEFDGVLWQLGDAPARALNPRFRGAQVSKDSVNKVLTEIGYGNQPGATSAAGTTNNVENIKVAYFFSLFVKVTNSLVRELSQEIIGDETKYLNYISKGKALDYLINHDPADPYLIETFENNLMVKCQGFFGAAMALSAYDMTAESFIIAPGTADAAQLKRQKYLDLYNNYKDPGSGQERITLNNQQTRTLKMLYYLKKGIVTSAEIDGINEYFKGQPDAQNNTNRALESRMPETTISCQEAWEVIAQFLADDYAPARTKYIIDIATGDGKDRNEACLDIEEKLTGTRSTDSSGCRVRLNRIVSLFILKNGVTRALPFARSAQYVANQEIEFGKYKQPAYMEIASAGGTVLAQAMPGGGMIYGFQQSLSPLAKGISSAASNAFGLAPNNNTQMDKFISQASNHESDKKKWQLSARLVNVGGITDAAFVELPRYQIRNLRQTLFSWALNVPYWQGVLLYLISIVYPFAALMVLIPSKAQSFLTVPMAWLWVKSWDLGFACSMVFEKILWNIFPSTQIKDQLVQTNLESNSLHEVLSEVQKYDHTWNLHMYYMMLSLVTLSVPTVMGYLTLKSKRAILASFTDKLMSDSKQSGESLAAGYKLNLASERLKVMRDAKGAAAMMTGKRENGGLLGGSGLIAGSYGGTRGQQISSFNKLQLLQDLAGIKSITPDQAMNVAAGQVDSLQKGLAQQIKFDRQQNMIDHPQLGRWGLIQTLNDAYATQFDQSGGFEITETEATSADSFIEAFTAKTERMYDYGVGIASNLIVRGTDIPGAHAGALSILKTVAGFEALHLAKTEKDKKTIAEAIEYINKVPGFEKYTRDHLLSEMAIAFDAPIDTRKIGGDNTTPLNYEAIVSPERRRELESKYNTPSIGSPAARRVNDNINYSLLETFEPIDLPLDDSSSIIEEALFIRKPVRTNFNEFNKK